MTVRLCIRCRGERRIVRGRAYVVACPACDGSGTRAGGSDAPVPKVVTMRKSELRRTLEQSEMTGIERLVWIALESYSDADLRCWPSIPSLCAFTGLADSTVRKTIVELEQHKLLTRTTARGHVTKYTLTPPGDGGPTPPGDGGHPAGRRRSPRRETAGASQEDKKMTRRETSSSVREAADAVSRTAASTFSQGSGMLELVTFNSSSSDPSRNARNVSEAVSARQELRKARKVEH